jgi:hypothetical protein
LRVTYRRSRHADERAVTFDVPGGAEPRLERVVLVAAIGADELLHPLELRIAEHLRDDVVVPQVGVEVPADAEVQRPALLQ